MTVIWPSPRCKPFYILYLFHTLVAQMMHQFFLREKLAPRITPQKLTVPYHLQRRRSTPLRCSKSCGSTCPGAASL
jgi:hypothetical protein